MAKDRKQKQNKGSVSGLLLKLAVVCASAYLVVAFVSGQMQVAEKQRELDEITHQVVQQTENNEELSRLMQAGNEDAYVERIAREKLDFVRPGERVFVDISGQ